MTRAARRLRRAVGILTTVSVVATVSAACSGDDDGDEAGASGTSSPTTEPVAALPGGHQIEVHTRHPVVEDPSRFSGKARPGVTWNGDYLVTTGLDNVVRVHDRENLELLWEVEVPSDKGYGVCVDPTVAPESTTLVVPVGLDCDRLLTYDLATGEKVEDLRLVDRVLHGVDFPEHVTGLRWVDGVLWYSTRNDVGYVAEHGRAVPLLDADDLGMVDRGNRSSQILGISSVPEDGLLVVQLLNSRDTTLELDDEWVGVAVSAGEEEPDAEVRWRLDDTPASLRMDDLRRPVPVEHSPEEPASVFLVGLTGGRIAIGQPDPETGRLTSPAITDGWPSLLEQDYVNDSIVVDEVLYTTINDSSDGHYSRGVAAYDLATGAELWHSRRLPPKPGIMQAEVLAHTVSLGDDGAVYVFVTDELQQWAALHRIDPETGKVEETWELPDFLDGDAYEVHVVGDAVVALLHEYASGAGPVTVLITEPDR